MGARYLVELEEIATGAGLDVVTVDGWQTRARNSGGFDGDRPWCIMWHHTASDTDPENDVGYICFQSPDAPLANLYLARDGQVWICAAGATNTNGKGKAMNMSRGVVPQDSMNAHAIGIEAANNGTGQTWPQVQIDAYFALSNALAAGYGLTPEDCSTHHAYAADRKIDPATADAVQGLWTPRSETSAGTWSLDDIRDECWLRSTPTPPPPPPSEDQMFYYVVTGANARFIGTPALVRWTGPGSPKVDAALQTQLDAGNLIQFELTGGPNAFAAAFLDGPKPTGDSLHDWTGDEFANSEQIRAGDS